MIKRTVTINNTTGLHARPASLFVKTANKFKSAITIEKDERKGDAKSIIGVLSIGAGKGAQVTIKAAGEDENLAVGQLAELLNSFDE